MIKYKEDADIFLSGADALVNPVNCVGVSGAGLAKKFKEFFPENFSAYTKACSENEVRPGQPYVFSYSAFILYIINFPTKRHFRDKSKVEDISSGLDWLKDYLENNKDIRSIAIPALGCGLGGLSWQDVKILIEEKLGLVSCEVLVYAPKGAKR